MSFCLPVLSKNYEAQLPNNVNSYVILFMISVVDVDVMASAC